MTTDLKMTETSEERIIEGFRCVGLVDEQGGRYLKMTGQGGKSALRKFPADAAFAAPDELYQIINKLVKDMKDEIKGNSL